jgi:hypothetical protein
MANVVVPEERLDFGAAPDFQRQIEAVLTGASGWRCSATLYVARLPIRLGGCW